MKVLCVEIEDYKYCMLPAGVDDLDSLLKYLNKNYNSFIKIKVWDDSKCVAPYFIDGLLKEELINVSQIRDVKIEEGNIYSEDEYLEMLLEVVKKKCVNCMNYDGTMLIDDLCRKNLSLKGECFFFSEREEEEA